MDAINKFIKSFGVARIIIAIFLLILFIVAPIFGVRVDTSLNDVIVRFGMSGIMVLSMVPMIQSGCGLNFGVPVGLVSGMMGAVVSLEFNLTGMAGIGVAFLVGLAMAAVLGFLYGLLLNRVKGDEMIIATYVGFSFVFLMNILWLKLPFKNPASVMGFKGEGLRVTISIEQYWIHVLSDFLKIPISKYLIIPTGMILFFMLMCLLVWGFFKTKLGIIFKYLFSFPGARVNIEPMKKE